VNDPGIVQIFDVGHAEEGLYYVAELVDGESLADRLRRGPLSPTEARGVAEQLCRALTGAHAQRVVHRDIKPANVLLTTDGRVKVGDFGIARLAEGSTDGAGATIVGTPRYMAPEQARGGPTSPATDVYSVGIVLYEMVSGRTPFIERSAVEVALRHLNDPPPPLPAGTPPALAEIVERALAKVPADRYPSAGAMADALARAGNSDPAGRNPPSRPRATPVPGPRRASPARSRAQRRSVKARPVGAKAAVAAVASVSSDGTAATAMLDRAPDEIPVTRVLAPTIPRREVNVNADRRRRVLVVAGAVVLLGIAAAVVVVLLLALGGQAEVKVPNVNGSPKAAIAAKFRRLDLKPAFGARYSGSPAGRAIAQSPRPGVRVNDGSTVRVVLSAGPAPIPVPQLVGQSGAQAQTLLGKLGLRGSLRQVAAPGVNTGIVTRESPAAGAELLPGANVTLLVAEPPRWRALTTFSGNASGHSVPFRILGKQWRVVYSMGYQGLCTLIFICSGPSAQVIEPATGAPVTHFDLNDGSDQTQVVKSGPGLYEIKIAPGSDTAGWSLTVEDYY
jgi:eukaryotic-like serine/threonine-protein kinase